jgi:predicted lipoprotein with Yx(FWY)xxD motif
VESHTGSQGAFLTDSAGKSLYLFASDTSTKSTCSAACLTAWPALTTTGAPTAGTGLTASDLGTITGTNGKKQVTYNGHPLYYFAGDSSAGQTNGQGSNSFGALWWLVTPAGAALTTSGGGTGGAASSSTSGGGGGAGGGY